MYGDSTGVATSDYIAYVRLGMKWISQSFQRRSIYGLYGVSDKQARLPICARSARLGQWQTIIERQSNVTNWRGIIP